MKLNIKSKKYIKKVPRLPRNFIKKCEKNENFKFGMVVLHMNKTHLSLDF